MRTSNLSCIKFSPLYKVDDLVDGIMLSLSPQQLLNTICIIYVIHVKWHTNVTKDSITMQYDI
jgi:hypothetical protein